MGMGSHLLGQSQSHRALPGAGSGMMNRGGGGGLPPLNPTSQSMGSLPMIGNNYNTPQAQDSRNFNFSAQVPPQ